MKGVTVFVCGEPKTMCTTIDCRTVATTACSFKLGGKRVGQTCGRAVCAKCAGGGTLCPPHRRLTDARMAT